MPANSNNKDHLQFAALAAHQLKSPVGAAATLLKTVLDEYAGELTPKQKDLLSKADARMEQALGSVRRILDIVQHEALSKKGEWSADLVAACHRVQLQHADAAAARHVTIQISSHTDRALVGIGEGSLTECIEALVSNAIKYTPEHGQIVLRIAAGQNDTDFFRLSVEDSGIGIPYEDRKNLFTPFYRASSARDTAVAGVGLGLAFVKALVEAAGGTIRVDQSELGGAAFLLDLPRVYQQEKTAAETAAEDRKRKVVIIGGVAAGPKVASKVIRLDPMAEVTVIERGTFLSYAGCGLPYYLSGIVKEQKELMASPLGMVRDPVFFQNVKRVTILSQTEATRIDRDKKAVEITDLASGRKSNIPYDTLVLTTGATPSIPPIPGSDLPNIFTLHGVRDAEGIRHLLSAGKARDVVIVGGGLLGVEMTEALVARGCRVTITEKQPQILNILDWEMARAVDHHLESNGVRVLTSTLVQSFRGEGRVQEVHTSKGAIPADMVLLAMGVRPNVDLAREAGLELGSTGAIRVSRRMQTSDPCIYAAGDCVETTDMVTGRPAYFPLGSTANKQGRAAAVNICGGQDEFPGVLGSTICKVFDFCVARTGLTEDAAREAGFDAVSVLTPSPDREHFMPGARMIMLKLVADRKSHRLLGAQCIGPGQGDKRIDVAATAILAGMTVEQVVSLDLCYAPPYSPAMDNIITAANVMKNKLAEHFEGISPRDVKKKMDAKEDIVLLDVSTIREHEEMRIPGTRVIPLGTLKSRINELPRDKEIIVFCTISLRGYEAVHILKAAGFRRVRVMDGGTVMWPYEKVYGR